MSSSDTTDCDSLKLEGLLLEVDELLATDPAKVLEDAPRMLELTDTHGSVDDQIRARRLLAQAYSRTNQFDRALEVCEEARTLPGSDASPIELARIRLASMEPLASIGDVDEAIETGKVALSSLDAHMNVALAGRAALNVGAIYGMLGRYNEALPFLDRAVDYLADEPLQVGIVEMNRGMALAHLDQFELAEQAYQRAVLFLETQDDMSWMTANVEGRLAHLAARQGEINRSLRHFELARRRFERDEALADLGRTNSEEAQALAFAGLTAVAREGFSEAIALLRDHGTAGDLAAAEIAFGTALVNDGDLGEAAEVLSETSQHINPDEQPDLYTQYLAMQAQLAIADNRYNDAAKMVEEGVGRVAQRPVQVLRWEVMQAELARVSGDVATATDTLQRALQRAVDAKITPLVAELNESLASIYRGQGERTLADEHARKAIAAAEEIHGTIQADRVRHSWHRGRLDVYGDFYTSLLSDASAHSQAEAFGVAERIRNRTLFDRLLLKTPQNVDRESISPEERPLIDLRDVHRRWLNWMYSALADGAEPTESQLVELQERERALAQVNDRLAVLRPHSGFEIPAELAAVQARLTNREVILSYLQVGDRFTVQVITADRVIGVHDLVSADVVNALVTRLQFQIGRVLAHGVRPVASSRQARLRRDADAVLTDLYDLLIEPLESALQGRERIVLIPSGALYSVPFAALYDGDSYLVDRFEVAVGPGVSILADMSRAGTVAGKPVTPLVISVADETAPQLDDEARLVARMLTGADCLIGDEATRDVVMSRMQGADLIHLGCHGRFDPVHPQASGLRLADGWLTLDRLMECQLKRPFVMLTGCETGRVRVDRGDDLSGIIVAFIASGAAGLVTSIWKTHDRAATQLMDNFYAALTSNVDHVTALTQAQRAARKQFDHPAMWASFIGVHAREKEVQI